MHHRKLTAAVLSGAALLALPALAAPAQAALLEHEKFSGVSNPDDPQFEDCGTFQLRHDWTANGMFFARDVRGSDFPIAMDTFHVDSVFTNTSTGHWFTTSVSMVQRDTQVSDVGGGFYRFEWRVAGKSFLLRDMAGKLVTHDMGNYSVSVVVDVAHDIAGPLELGAVHGPHPNLEKTMCEIAEEYDLT